MDNLNDLTIKGTMSEEQETVIQWYHNDDTMRIYTCDPTFLTKLKGILDGKEYTIERVTSRSVQVVAKREDILIGKGRKMNLTDEQRDNIRKRAEFGRRDRSESTVEIVE